MHLAVLLISCLSVSGLIGVLAQRVWSQTLPPLPNWAVIALTICMGALAWDTQQRPYEFMDPDTQIGSALLIAAVVSTLVYVVIHVVMKHFPSVETDGGDEREETPTSAGGPHITQNLYWHCDVTGGFDARSERLQFWQAIRVDQQADKEGSSVRHRTRMMMGWRVERK